MSAKRASFTARYRLRPSLAAVPVAPLLFLRREEPHDALALGARQQERQPAQRRMAELDQRAARKFVQDGPVPRRMQEAGLLRRLVGHRRRHLLADLTQ